MAKVRESGMPPEGMWKSFGRIGVMHWNYDPETPRGPPISIRLTSFQVRQWMEEAGFSVSERIELPPYHYGFIGRPFG